MKKINKCPSWDEIYGCGISPEKKCKECDKADWLNSLKEKIGGKL